MSIASSSQPIRRITISVPGKLVDGLDEYVAAGAAPSRTDLINEAIEHELRRLRRAAIDAQNLDVTRAPAFLRVDNQLAAEFESSNRETWTVLDEADGGYFNEPK
jgi:Arc/MetJ-type ribon-helix-helix transcriptional regulator